MLELAIAAADGVDAATCATWVSEHRGHSGMTFDQPIRLDVPRLLQVTLTIRGANADFTPHSRAAGSRDAWTKHATARVTATATRLSSRAIRPNRWPTGPRDRRGNGGPRALRGDERRWARIWPGVSWHPAVVGRRRRRASGRSNSRRPRPARSKGEGGRRRMASVLAMPSARPAAHDARYAMHPAMLDAAFQTVAAAAGRTIGSAICRAASRTGASWTPSAIASGVTSGDRARPRGPDR